MIHKLFVICHNAVWHGLSVFQCARKAGRRWISPLTLAKLTQQDGRYPVGRSRRPVRRT